MKKISLLLCSLFTASVFTGCGSQNITPMPVQNIQPQQNQQVSTLSRKGANLFYELNLKKGFEVADKNKDNVISLEEFNPFLNQPSYPSYPSEPPSYPNPSEPEPLPPSDGVSAASFGKTQPANNLPTLPTSEDFTKRFIRVDSNRDGRLTLKEVTKNGKDFLGVSKKDMRKQVEQQFTTFDKDRSKSLTADEYFMSMPFPPADQAMYRAVFNASDRNRNGSLNFSEFEDMVYNVIKTYIETPPQPVTPPPAPPSYDDPDLGYSDPGYGSPDYGYGTPGNGYDTPDTGYGTYSRR